ncbi:hypothetical protein PV10_06336 [Exophiala mesophila]|uniref:ATP phosphoribosyltransferase n=1 Tax=Exophiala mesophila TaxID=212818 RepID=A0A0D1ZY67_EXOME|nr:uncharacterized protein PV10_06336 [Exophiala mesophila]KIV91843.1 hypothetical protein PV10_06336 [Exophiala mesophila]
MFPLRITITTRNLLHPLASKRAFNNPIPRAIHIRRIESKNLHHPLLQARPHKITGGAPTQHHNNPTMTSSDSSSTMYQLTFYVPTQDTQRVLSAVHATGAGTWPNDSNSPEKFDNVADPPKYVEVAFITRGTGQFRPTEHAKPHIGTAGGEVEYVDENKVEMVVMGTEVMRKAVEALKETHPYEVVAFFVTRCESV